MLDLNSFFRLFHRLIPFTETKRPINFVLNLVYFQLQKTTYSICNRRWTVFSIKESISKLERKSSDKFRIFPWGYHTTIVPCLAATFNVRGWTCVSSWWGCNLPLSRGRTPSSKPTAPASPGCWPAQEPSGTASTVHRRLQLESKIDTPNSWYRKDRLTFRQQDGWIVSGSTYLLREMKAAYSILWVEPGVVTLLGVSSTKIMWGLDRALFSFSWTSFSLKLICWSVFLRCLYQPITLSFQRGKKNKNPHQCWQP